ncbi:MAG: hypothetical protein J6B49_01090 [Phascolarctobacterium sp.]|nr:hypothetical protein [Phascolarctobacterium sp.]
MERYLITQSLLSSWAYSFNAAEGYEEEAKADFLRTLHREKSEPNENMLNGLEFESLCYKIAEEMFQPKWKAELGKCNPKTGEVQGRNVYPKFYEGACKVAPIIKGAPVQVKVARELQVGDMTFLVYGILDALKAGTIYDIKFLNSSMGSSELAGKYLESPQHPFYFYLVPEAFEFQYLVSDGKDLYIEKYSREDSRQASDCIAEFISSITQLGLLDIYKEHWNANNEG